MSFFFMTISKGYLNILLKDTSLIYLNENMKLITIINTNDLPEDEPSKTCSYHRYAQPFLHQYLDVRQQDDHPQ